MQKHRTGFTLTESLVAIAIMMSLGAIMLPGFARAYKQARTDSSAEHRQHIKTRVQSPEEAEEQRTLELQVGMR